MNIAKRAAAVLLALSLLALPALAAGDAAVECAERLHTLGLFQGINPDRFDQESMALDQPATRIEALVMFLRLMGWEDAALSSGLTHSFPDVDDWAGPYVGYAWQNHLTNGLDDGTFGSARTVTLNEYVTFVLRALGYDDAGGDFAWNIAAAKGESLGLYDADFLAQHGGSLTRGDLAQVSYAALSLTVKDSTLTMAGYLANAGAVDGDALTALGLTLDTAPPPPAKPVEYPYSDYVSISPDDIVIDDDTRAQIEEVFALVNEARAEEGHDPLVLDEELTVLAMVRAHELNDYYSHIRPNGDPCFRVMSENGFEYISAGENIAAGYPTPESVMNGWLNSPGHRANIMRDKYGRIGIGMYNRRWVQIFAD